MRRRLPGATAERERVSKVEAFEEAAKARPEFGMFERELDVRLQEAFLAAAVVAPAVVAIGEHLLAPQQAGDGFAAAWLIGSTCSCSTLLR